MSKLNTLFDFSKFEKRKPADQQTFEANNEVVLSAFINAVHTSFQKLHTVVLRSIEPMNQDKNLCATVMSGYLCGFFKKHHPMICGKATKQRFKLWTGSTLLYIKKLDEKTKLPSNIPTDESLKIYHQLTESDREECNIFLGYTVTDSWSMVTGVFAVCIEGEKLLWISDLSNLGSNSQTPIIPFTPNPITPKLKPGVARRKIKNE